MKMFKCDPLQDGSGEIKYYLQIDLSMECYGTLGPVKHPIGIVAGVLGGFVVLIPGFVVVFLRHFRAQKTGEVLNDPTKLKEGEELGEELSALDSKYMKKTFGLFYKSYERAFYFFEAIDLVRKFLLVAGLALVKPGSVTQLMLAQLVCFSYVVLVVNTSPYKKADADFANQARAASGRDWLQPPAPRRKFLLSLLVVFFCNGCSLTHSLTLSFVGALSSVGAVP